MKKTIFGLLAAMTVFSTQCGEYDPSRLGLTVQIHQWLNREIINADQANNLFELYSVLPAEQIAEQITNDMQNYHNPDVVTDEIKQALTPILASRGILQDKNFNNAVSGLVRDTESNIKNYTPPEGSNIVPDDPSRLGLAAKINEWRNNDVINEAQANVLFQHYSNPEIPIAQITKDMQNYETPNTVPEHIRAALNPILTESGAFGYTYFPRAISHLLVSTRGDIIDSVHPDILDKVEKEAEDTNNFTYPPEEVLQPLGAGSQTASPPPAAAAAPPTPAVPPIAAASPPPAAAAAPPASQNTPIQSPTRWEQIGSHLQRHKKAYIVGGTATVVTATAITAAVLYYFWQKRKKEQKQRELKHADTINQEDLHGLAQFSGE